MLDIHFIRNNPDFIDDALKRRGHEPISKKALELDGLRRDAIQQCQEIQTIRNEKSKKIGEAKAKGEQELAENMMLQVSELKDKLKQGEEQERNSHNQLNQYLAAIPNIPFPEIPDGNDENGNIEIRRHGNINTKNTKQHFEIGEELGLMNFEKAAKLSGARFVVLQGQLAQLERALGNFMIDVHVNEFQYTEISAPVLVRDESLFGTGQLPKFEKDLFKTEEGLWLIPTAEVTLTNLYQGDIISAEELPLRMTALTQCFRSEAGSAGKDTRGMIRQHQFSKVELVSIVAAEDAEQELERMTNCAEMILQKLELPYRVMNLCAGDIGFSARKTYDIEVWLPGQNAYREISSCSVCGDYQARRMNTRWRHHGEKQTEFVHTLNGSGLAIGRTLVAILENYIEEDGRVVIPKILQPYMNHQTYISAENG